MRRFRLRRRRYAAALLPLAATISIVATAQSAPAIKHARIEPSAASVPVGERVTLRGAFPGTAGAPLEVRFRAKGASSWRAVAHGTTGAGGRYRIRVRPPASGYWRAELTGAPTTQSAAEGATPAATAAGAAGVDAGTGTARIGVRSRTRARVAERSPTVGGSVKIRGQVTPAGAKRRVVVHVGAQRVTTRAGRDGRFSVRWRASSTGTYAVRANARTNRTATGSHDRAGRVTVYRPAAASWYGPGLYGNALACGGTLTPTTMGVANRTLPCGTKVRLRYGSRSVTVPVIDRGPYAGNREYDLTAATRQALGFGDVGTVLTDR